MCKWRV
jgi:hypothetical protein